MEGGTAEQWIQEGKNAFNWTRLSCHRFRNNAARLQLHALAYNLGNLLRTLVLTPDRRLLCRNDLGIGGVWRRLARLIHAGPCEALAGVAQAIDVA